MYSALPNTDLASALNTLEILLEAREHLRAFWDTMPDLYADTGVVKVGEEIATYDYDDLYHMIDKYMEQRIATAQAVITKSVQV